VPKRFNLGCFERRHRLLLFSFEAANKSYERIDLFFIEFVRERRHVATHVAPVHDRVEDAFVADVSLPLRVGQIARVAELSF
jgi:hypothetical protein